MVTNWQKCSERKKKKNVSRTWGQTIISCLLSKKKGNTNHSFQSTYGVNTNESSINVGSSKLQVQYRKLSWT